MPRPRFRRIREDGTPIARHCRVCAGAALHRLAEVKGYPFLECSECGYVFTPVISPRGQSERYGSGWHGVEDGAPEIGWANTIFLQPALELLRDRGPMRVLDFGTGQSLVPDILRDQGHRVIAVDVAPPIREHPDRLTGRLPELGLEPAQFDLAFSFQVFEHLADPIPYFREMIRLTRLGGLVLVHTDMETPERAESEFEDWWYVLPPDHCAFFRHRTWERLLEGTPHRIVFREPKAVIVEVG